MVDHMDQAVGKMIAALKASGHFDNTLIVYAHDNGACAEHLKGNAWNTVSGQRSPYGVGVRVGASIAAMRLRLYLRTP